MMEIGYVVGALWRLRWWVALGLPIGALAACAVTFELPSLEKKSFEIGAASTEVLVEARGQPLGLAGAQGTATAERLTSQTLLYARLLSTSPVRALIQRESGVTAGPIAVGIPAALQTGRAVASEERANELLVERSGYRILASPSVELPLITIATQAPTAVEATRLANGAVRALRRYLSETAREAGVVRRVGVRQLGPAVGGLVTKNTNVKVAALAFVGAWAAWAFLVLTISRIRRSWREAQRSVSAADRLHIPDAPPNGAGGQAPTRPPAPAPSVTK